MDAWGSLLEGENCYTPRLRGAGAGAWKELGSAGHWDSFAFRLNR